MPKKIIKKMFIAVLFGVGIGYGFGRFYSYFHPMVALEGYWESNYDLEHAIGFYHVYSRISIVGREINSSADVYDGNGYVKARRNIVFNVVDSKKNIFTGKVLSLSIEGDKDLYLNDFLNTPYAVSYPIFHQLNGKTILMEQSQGHPVNSLRLLTRI
ncbi:hypothetical protein [Yersinia enterocolitica]|nr:hypothetical protein [Yersinia enterocolitica]AJJ22229.1 hypothetical protein CH49_2788 [Yersinia enterocolitica]CRY25549.1 Uncharacterised protein [Yersinia enterocolitica]HDL8281463.1 hypothetical protein [Yersinia enterocolitica]